MGGGGSHVVARVYSQLFFFFVKDKHIILLDLVDSINITTKLLFIIFLFNKNSLHSNQRFSCVLPPPPQHTHTNTTTWFYTTWVNEKGEHELNCYQQNTTCYLDRRTILSKAVRRTKTPHCICKFCEIFPIHSSRYSCLVHDTLVSVCCHVLCLKTNRKTQRY